MIHYNSRSQQLVHQEQAIWKLIYLLIQDCRIKSVQLQRQKLAIQIFYDRTNNFKQKGCIPLTKQEKFQEKMKELRPRINEFREKNRQIVQSIAMSFEVDKQQLDDLVNQVQQRNFNMIRSFFAEVQNDKFLKCIWPNQIYKSKSRKTEVNPRKETTQIQNEPKENQVINLPLNKRDKVSLKLQPIEEKTNYNLKQNYGNKQEENRQPKQIKMTLEEAYLKVLIDFSVEENQINENLGKLKNNQFNQVADDAVKPYKKNDFLKALLSARDSCKNPVEQNIFEQKLEQLLKTNQIDQRDIQQCIKLIIKDQNEAQVAQSFLRRRERQNFCKQVKELRQKYTTQKDQESLSNKLNYQQMKKLLIIYKVGPQNLQKNLSKLELGKVKQFVKQNLLQTEEAPFLQKLSKIISSVWQKNWKAFERQLQNNLKIEKMDKTQIKSFIEKLKTSPRQKVINQLTEQSVRQKISQCLSILEEKHKINYLTKLNSCLIQIFNQQEIPLQFSFKKIILVQAEEIPNDQQIMRYIRKAKQDAFKGKVLNSCKIKQQEQKSLQKMGTEELFNQILKSLLKSKALNHAVKFEIIDIMFDRTTDKFIEQVQKLPKKLSEKLLFWKKQILPSSEFQKIELKGKIDLNQQEQKMITQIIQARVKILKQIKISNLRNQIKQTIREYNLQNIDIRQKARLLNQKKQDQLPRIQQRALEKQILELEKIIQKIQSAQQILAKLEYQFKDMTDFLIQNIQLESKQKITGRQTFQAFLKLVKEQITSHLTTGDLQNYFQGKKQVLNLLLWQRYKENNQEQINKCCRIIVFKKQKKTVFIQTKKPLIEFLRAKFKIPSIEIVVLAIKDGKQFSIFDLQTCQTQSFLKQTEGCSLQIKLGQPMIMNINNQCYNIIMSKSISIKMVKQMCKKILQLNFDYDSFELKGISLDSQQYDLKDTIEATEVVKRIKIKALEIVFNVEILVYYDSYFIKKILSSKDTVKKLKIQIQKDNGIPVNSQVIFGIIEGKQKQEQFENEKILSSLVKKNNKIQVSLISRVSLLHYGFNQRIRLTNQQFICFFVQKTQNKQTMIQNFKFRNSNQRQVQSSFLRNIIPYLYSGLKKRFLFEVITEGFQQRISQSMSQDIWMENGQSSTFNSNFISVYLLSNSDEKLRIILMNIMKQLYPIPMYFRSYQNINKVKNQWTLNQQLVWILHASINICSVGLHTQQQNQNGKSNFLNKIFFTSFTQRNLRHPISQGSPEIALSIYGKYFQLNLIDIPRLCPSQIEKKVIGKSNILLIHSWKSKEQTQQYIAEIKRKFPRIFIICFLRDNSINLTKNSRTIKQTEFVSGVIVAVSNFQRTEQKHVVFSTLRDKINEVIKKNFSKVQKCQTKNLFQLYQNRLFNSFQIHLQKIQEKMHELRVVGNFNDELNQLNRKNQTEIVKRDIQVLKLKAKNLKLHPVLYEIFHFISENNQKSDILFQRFKQIIKKFKEQAEKPYSYIYQSKKNIENLSQKNPAQFRQEIQKINSKLNSIKNIKIDIREKSKEEVLNLIIQKGIQLESQIKPFIFSIQLAWRQLVYLAIHNPESCIGNTLVQTFLVNSRKRQARMSQPFEIIDGDSLEMPKKMLKQMFGGFNKKVAVISILGPQSSGKSTLLNFLFGCDFSVSQGRCTRGVYGSYFDLSNMKYLGVDGIFILDTEGLFAIVNKKDEKNRRDFDSKLVLFCLTVCDIVIINTKGCIDNETSKKLKSAKDKFDALCEQGVEEPKFFLVLNQGNSGSTQTNEADINKLSQIFPMKNSHSLGQAYQIKPIGKDQISLLENNQKIIKKEAKKQFLQSVFCVLDNIVNQIQDKGNFRYISQAIDHMQNVWVTIEKFPNLANSSSKKVKQMEELLTKWKSKQLHQQLNNCCKSMTQKYQAKQYNKKNCENQMNLLCQKIMQDFQQKFKNEDEFKSEEQVNKINLEQKNIELYIASSKNQLLSNISDIQLMNAVKLARQQGNSDINQAIRQIKIRQNNQKMQIPESEKIQIFQKAYQKLVQKTQKEIDVKNQITQSFDRIKQNYSIAISTSSTNTSRKREAGLLRQLWPLQFNSRGYEDLFRQQILNNQQKLIQYSQKSHTNVLRGGLTDASFKYFNMKQYFKNKTQKKYIVISKTDILSLLQPTKLAKDIFNQNNKQQINNTLLNNIYQGINRQLNFIGFNMADKQKFKKILNQKSRWINLFSWVNHQDVIKIICAPNDMCNYSKVEQKIDCKKFITIESLKDMIKKRDALFHNQKKQDNRIFLSSISTQITKNSIQWSQIIKFIQAREKDQYYCQKQNNLAKSYLQQDLEHLNIEIEVKNFFQWLSLTPNQRQSNQQNTKDVKINQRGPPNIYKTQKQMSDAIKSLKYFNGNELLFLKRQVSCVDDSMICLFCYDEQILEPIQKFKNTPQLKKYLSDSTKEVTEVLKTSRMRAFLLKELKDKGKIDLLIQSIKEIVDKSPSNLDKKTIQAIFSDVNRQIAAFNNDINQVSCQMSLIFDGYCHLYAVYSTWKKFATETERIKRAPLVQLIDDKQKQKRYFLNETSGNQQMICETQCDKFLDEVLAHVKKVVQISKITRIEQTEKKYKKQNTRQKVQQKIDIQTFRQQTPFQEILKYLQNPKQIVEAKYQSQIIIYLNSLEVDFSKNSIAKDIYKQISQCIKQMRKQLSINGHQIKAQQASFNNFFSIISHGKQQTYVGDPVFQEKTKKVFLQYVLDLFIQEQQEQYIADSFIAKPDKKKIMFKRHPIPCLQNLIYSLKKADLRISNLVIFVEKISKKLLDMKQKIQQTTQINQVDKATFRQKVKINVCSEKCPGCQRICGEEGNHPQHKCKFGHQMRALGNVKLLNGQASVIRCQDLRPFNIIAFNGKDMTWTQFKSYFEKHQNVKWKFDDLIPGSRKQIFDLAWNIVGKDFCRKKQMKWVQSNKISLQNQISRGFVKTHYIFALDQSGSMSGKPWKDVIGALTEALNSIRKLNSNDSFRISIIKFDSTSIIFQENKTPKQVSLQIPFRGGGTQFTAPFQQTIQIANKYIKQFKIVFMFMSDGGASYPTNQIKTMQNIQSANPGRFAFNGLQFGSANSSIKQMAIDLKGTTSGAIHGQYQLASAYKEIINREMKQKQK